MWILGAKDIIVITPYHAQKMKLRQLFCQDRHLEDIRIGSVEEFQGQVCGIYLFAGYTIYNLIWICGMKESRVVIMSTVRSNDQYVSGDVRSQLGFVAQPQRMNGEPIYHHPHILG